MRRFERFQRLSLVLIVLALLVVPASRAWEVRLNGTAHYLDTANDVVIDPNGDVIAVGSMANGPLYDGFDDADRDFFVVKVANTTGAELWRRVIDGGDFDSAEAVEVDAAGDIIVAGEIEGSGAGSIVKLSGMTGEEIWRHAGPLVAAGARSIMVDAAGDVIVAGSSPGDPDLCVCIEFAVVKLDGITGVERWRYGIAGSTGFAHALAADGEGNVVAVGLADASSGIGYDTVVKLAGLTGTEVWRARLANPGSPYENLAQVVVDSAGDVIVGGSIQNPTTSGDLVVAKLAGANGDEEWRRTIDGASHRAEDIAFALAVDGSGDVVAAGTLENEPHYGTFVVTKLAAATGIERWRYERLGTNGTSLDVAVHGSGDVIAVGSSGPAPLHAYFTIGRLDGTTGAPRWFHVFEEHDGAAVSLTIDAAGDAVAAGSIDYPDALSEFGPTGDFVVFKLRGTDGGLPPADGCGNGAADPGEECDDGNRDDGDGCSAGCLREDGPCGAACPELSCTTTAECDAQLLGALPARGAGDSKVARKATAKLRKLAKSVHRIIGRAAGKRGARQTKLYDKAVGKVQRILLAARSLDDAGLLTVPLQPIEAAANGIVRLIGQVKGIAGTNVRS